MLQNREGQRVPDVTFRVRQNNEWKNVTSTDRKRCKRVRAFHIGHFQVARVTSKKTIDVIAIVPVTATP